MSFGAGSLTIAARRVGASTVLERVRYDGISRCSRAFRRGHAALVVLSQLGPGVVRGDDVQTIGRLHSDAHLIVTGQAATRIMGGSRLSRWQATWRLDARAILELVGEPLVAAANGRYESSIDVELGDEACVLFTEVARVPRGADVRLRSVVRRNGHELFYDAFDAAAAAPQAVGTFALIGLREERIAPLVATLDVVADALRDIEIGIGILPTGAFGRILGTDVWTVRSALDALRLAASSAFAASRDGFPVALSRSSSGA